MEKPTNVEANFAYDNGMEMLDMMVMINKTRDQFNMQLIHE